jgi:FtsP/CotA-like multicopper oxidase with cupredoxin domain
LTGGDYASNKWEINGKTYPNTQKIYVHRNDVVTVHFHNKTDMDHPMHLHGHVFQLIEVDGKHLSRPLAKDTSLVRANGGTATWSFKADSPAGRWLLHCHNEIHMMDGMMTEVVYRS